MATEFTPVLSTLGGVMIGVSASVMLLAQGRIAGISGIVGGLLSPQPGDVGWRVAFVSGMVVGGAVLFGLMPAAFEMGLQRSPVALVVAGLLVGFGTRLGNGCTSGHGVCGLSRFSQRSLASVMTFMFTGGVAAAVVHHLFGGVL